MTFIGDGKCYGASKRDKYAPVYANIVLSIHEKNPLFQYLSFFATIFLLSRVHNKFHVFRCSVTKCVRLSNLSLC